jgi:hypothetical protein
MHKSATKCNETLSKWCKNKHGASKIMDTLETYQGYQYALHQHRKKLRGEKDEFRRSQENNSVSSGAYWDEYSDASESSRERHRDPKHSRRTKAWAREESCIKSISEHPSDDEEDFVQEMPEAALVAAQAYLLTMEPDPGDPREHMHQATIQSLGLVEDRLRKHPPEKKATCHKEKRKESFKCQPSQSQTCESSGNEKHKARREDARNIIAQARVNNARYAWKEENYEDDKKDMGALCFTRRVRRTWVPKGLKLPHDQQKYDGSQEPTLWLSDYLQKCKYSEEREQHDAKPVVAPHRRSMVLVKYSTQQFHRELGRAREPIHNKFLVNI